jgi:hypothetical protein
MEKNDNLLRLFEGIKNKSINSVEFMELYFNWDSEEKNKFLKSDDYLLKSENLNQNNIFHFTVENINKGHSDFLEKKIIYI